MSYSFFKRKKYLYAALEFLWTTYARIYFSNCQVETGGCFASIRMRSLSRYIIIEHSVRQRAPTVTGIKKPGIIARCAVRQIDGVILNQMRNVAEACVCVTQTGEIFRLGSFSLPWQAASFGADKKPLRHRDAW